MLVLIIITDTFSILTLSFLYFSICTVIIDYHFARRYPYAKLSRDEVIVLSDLCGWDENRRDIRATTRWHADRIEMTE